MSWRSVGDEIIILNLETAQYLILNASATLLWQALLNGPIGKAAMVEQLLGEFDVSRDTAEVDVEEFLATCEREDLLAPMAVGGSY